MKDKTPGEHLALSAQAAAKALDNFAKAVRKHQRDTSEESLIDYNHLYAQLIADERGVLDVMVFVTDETTHPLSEVADRSIIVYGICLSRYIRGADGYVIRYQFKEDGELDSAEVLESYLLK